MALARQSHVEFRFQKAFAKRTCSPVSERLVRNSRAETKSKGWLISALYTWRCRESIPVRSHGEFTRIFSAPRPVLEQAAWAFDQKIGLDADEAREREIEKRHAKIGQLTVERDFFYPRGPEDERAGPQKSARLASSYSATIWMETARRSG
jgi:hypothetical protein